jgi:hypothetical protein
MKLGNTYYFAFNIKWNQIETKKIKSEKIQIYYDCYNAQESKTGTKSLSASCVLCRQQWQCKCPFRDDKELKIIFFRYPEILIEE